ncbi:hypothetical protein CAUPRSCDRAFT_9160, partial [Caulochytrium protostelioides]
MIPVEVELAKLKEEIKRLGSQNDQGHWHVSFGVLVRDDRVADIFEGVVGTLKAAKKRKIVAYDAELLLQGVHDSVDIVL